MATRCTKPWPRPDGSTTVLLGCCRIAGHTGECHGHFSGRLTRYAHVTVHRGSDHLLIGCSEGEALDGEQPHSPPDLRRSGDPKGWGDCHPAQSFSGCAG